MRRIMVWVFCNIPLGPLAPHVFHMLMPGACTMRRVK